MTRAADAEILPRWRSLAAHEIRTKDHEWDLVTDADVESEKLTHRRVARPARHHRGGRGGDRGQPRTPG